MDAINNLNKDITIIMIAHRLNTVKKCDKIFLLENNLIKKSKNQILLNNLKKNSKWITLNSVLIQFYDLFDKYLIKFFLGPVAVATYSIPQQLTGKLSIISKSFSAFLLPNLSKRKIDNQILCLSPEFQIKKDLNGNILQIYLKTTPGRILLNQSFECKEEIVN